MKRTIVFYLIAIPLLFSCHFKNKNHDDENLNGNQSSSKLIGCYTQNVNGNTIALYISNVINDSIRGDFEESSGNWLTVAEPISEDDGIYTVQVKEMQDSNLLGFLNFSFDTTQLDKVKGDWKPVSLMEETYSLQRKNFSYSPDSGTYPQASLRLLVDSDVNNAYKEDLQEMRNEIYARHGFCFKNSTWQFQFETSDWYIPYSVDVTKDLTDIEKKNISLIKKYEKTAKEDEDFDRQ
jgi:hypothetical protein